MKSLEVEGSSEVPPYPLLEDLTCILKKLRLGGRRGRLQLSFDLLERLNKFRQRCHRKDRCEERWHHSNTSSSSRKGSFRRDWRRKPRSQSGSSSDGNNLSLLLFRSRDRNPRDPWRQRKSWECHFAHQGWRNLAWALSRTLLQTKEEWVKRVALKWD